MGKVSAILNSLFERNGAVLKMDINLLSLRFPDALELRYLRDSYTNNVFIMRLLLLLGAFMYAAFSLLDYLTLRSVFVELFKIRFFVVIPSIAIVYVLSYRPIFMRKGQFLMTLAIGVASVGIVVMTVVASDIGCSMYYSGLLLVLFFNYVLRIRFVLATIIGWSVMLLYFVSVLLYPDISKEVVVMNGFFLFATNIVGMFAAYSIEFFMRRNYIFSMRIDQEKNRVLEMNEKLEERVRVKTLELQNDIEYRIKVEEDLILAKEKAEESERLKTAFLNNMSHEVRTPMNGIMGFADMLSMVDPKSPKFKHYLSVMKVSANRLMNTVDDLIAISKVQTGQLDVLMSHFDLNLLLEDVFKSFKEVADNKQLTFEYNSCSKSEIKVFTDKQKVKFIVASFVKNAITFTEQGSVNIVCRFLDKDGFVIEVSDTGIGIPVERQKAIFNRFEKADIEDVKAHQGAGLGLSLSLAYAEKLEAEIRLQSELGQGSTFSLILPVSIVVNN